MAIKILYYGSCWPTNIGNAFVNLGAIEALKAALGTRAQITHFGGMSSHLFKRRNLPHNNLDIAQLTQFDYVVMGGMTQCLAHCQGAERLITSFIERGAKIVIAGGGASRYDDDEVRSVRRWMTKLPIYAFVSRDSYSYENYGDLATYSLDGIDSAFFISGGFTPIQLDSVDFDVLTFDTMEEPVIVNCGDDRESEVLAQSSGKVKIGTIGEVAIRKIRRLRGRSIAIEDGIATYSPIDLEGRIPIRAHHSCFSPKPSHFERPNTLISDLPSDYLSLYNQANTVYSDRIHACIASLALGSRAMLFGRKVPRLRMFQRVGAEEILQRPVRLSQSNLDMEKQKQIEFFRCVLQ